VRTNQFNDPRSERPLTFHLAKIVYSILAEHSISSCKLFSHHFNIAKVIDLHIFHDKLRLNKFHLRWVLHCLATVQADQMIFSSNLFLATIEEAQSNGFDRFIADNEF
jgi:hypothetical protein